MLIFVSILLLLQLVSIHECFHFVNNASCRSDEYCPAGWSVKRRPEDYSALTCNPAAPPDKKCPKPYMCVAARCGINFCCASDKMIDRFKQNEEREAEAREEEAERQREEIENSEL